MRWPTLTFCQASICEAEEPGGVRFTALRMVGFVGIYGVGSLTVDQARESYRAR
jgi:hypothetical protein